MDKPDSTETNKLANFAKLRVWLFGVALFLVGAIERTVTFLSDGVMSLVDVAQLLTIVVFLLAWLSLKPE